MDQGFAYYPAFLSPAAQRGILADLDDALREAPLFTPVMPRTGRPLSVRMTNLGRLGWVSDRRGYRYDCLHPQTGRPWPPIPQGLLDVWRTVSAYPHDPEACLVNYYGEKAKMGLHRDADENEFAAPVVSISLGDTAIFRIGGLARAEKTSTFKLSSGDIVVLGGAPACATTASTAFCREHLASCRKVAV
jgi:alkylated DNA repair protein (DNA oxidative demethylase)